MDGWAIPGRFCWPCRWRAILIARGAFREAGQQVANGQTEFGPVLRIEADAVGPPGRRAFRLLATRADASAWLWVEREQLQALAMLIEQLLTGLPALDLRATQSRPPESSGRQESAPSLPPEVEFKVGQLALGYDEAQRLYLILAHDVESDLDGPARFSCQVTRPQLRTLADGIVPL